MKVVLKNVRLAFPQLWEAKTVNGEGKPAFSASFILDPKHPSVKELRAAFTAVAKEKWADKADSWLKQLEKGDKLALHDGDDKSAYEGFEGNMYVSARSQTRPQIRDRDKSALTREDGKPYGGCYVNAIVDVWAQDNNYGKRVNATLLGVQFVKDGDPFSGGSVADDADFEDMSDLGGDDGMLA